MRHILQPQLGDRVYHPHRTAGRPVRIGTVDRILSRRPYEVRLRIEGLPPESFSAYSLVRVPPEGLVAVE
jgi:hypothetical protein